MPQYLICKNEKSVLLWALTKVSRRNQVMCLSFAFPGFVRTEQHSYDFQIQVMLAQWFSFHYRPGSGSDLFLPLLVAPCRCLLRTVVQMLHPCISFLHKRRDFAVLLQFHFFDAVFRNRPIPVYRRIFRIWLFSRCCLLRTIVQTLHPCISFLHKHTDFAVLLWFHVFDAVF